jgi:hypothetical protein
LKLLLEVVGENGEIWIFHNDNQSTFHPKIYCFSNSESADVIIGSGNLTQGGLFTNYEASLASNLNLSQANDKTLYDEIQSVLLAWANPENDTVQLLTEEFLKQLFEAGYIPKESDLRAELRRERHAEQTEGGEKSKRPSLFARVPVPHAPAFPAIPSGDDLPDEVSDEDYDVEPPVPVAPQGGRFTGFLMVLQKTDVGVGQTTAGTSRRSPEIFIPLSARDYDPDFWGWGVLFELDTTKPGKMDRTGVKMRIGADIVDVNMMTWPDKHDFRLRSEALRSAGNIGDILRMERADGQNGFSYYVEIIPFRTSHYNQYFQQCVNAVKNSQKRWGYY